MTVSRAANAKISAQETTPGHAASSCVLALSMTSNPWRLRFGPAVLSVLAPDIRIEPSQPWTNSRGNAFSVFRVRFWGQN